MTVLGCRPGPFQHRHMMDMDMPFPKEKQGSWVINESHFVCCFFQIYLKTSYQDPILFLTTPPEPPHSGWWRGRWHFDLRIKKNRGEAGWMSSCYHLQTHTHTYIVGMHTHTWTTTPHSLSPTLYWPGLVHKAGCVRISLPQHKAEFPLRIGVCGESETVPIYAKVK